MRVAGNQRRAISEQQRRQARGERGAADHHRDAAGEGGPGQKVERKVEHQGGQHAKVHVIRSVVIGAIPQVVLARSIHHLLALGAVIGIVELSHPCRRVYQQRCPPCGEGSRQLEVAVGGVGVLVDVLYGERGRRGPLFQIRLVVETGGDAGVCGLGEEDGRAAQDEDERYARGCEPEQAGVLRRGCAKGAASADDEREGDDGEHGPGALGRQVARHNRVGGEGHAGHGGVGARGEDGLRTGARLYGHAHRGGLAVEVQALDAGEGVVGPHLRLAQLVQARPPLVAAPEGDVEQLVVGHLALEAHLHQREVGGRVEDVDVGAVHLLGADGGELVGP